MRGWKLHDWGDFWWPCSADICAWRGLEGLPRWDPVLSAFVKLCHPHSLPVWHRRTSGVQCGVWGHDERLCGELEVDTWGQKKRREEDGSPEESVGEEGGAGKRQEGTRRGNGSTPVLSPGTAQPWAVITNHTFHFWGDIFLLLDQWRGIRGDLKSQKESRSWGFYALLGSRNTQQPMDPSTYHSVWCLKLNLESLCCLKIYFLNTRWKKKV